MSSDTHAPTIGQGAKQAFKENFYKLASQEQSMLESSPIVMHDPMGAKASNTARIGRLELAEVDGRNPDKQYGDYALDNRQLTRRRFTRTITIDAKHDVEELIADPTGMIVQRLVEAKGRETDRVLAAAAVGSVLVGDPTAALTSLSAASDGVITVDATAGLTYEKIQEITENFVNNDLQLAQIKSSLINISGKENTNLMAENEFINNDYINSKPTAGGVISDAGIYMVNVFAGSKTGGITVDSPILPEVSTTRSCFVAAPGALTLAMEIGRMEVERSASKVNSFDITIDLWLNAMRNEGVKVQHLTTTI